VLLLLDCPNGLEFGIDNISWKIGNKFKGVKMVPLGTHIIAYSLQSENYMFKISRFLLFTQEQRIQIHRWNEKVN
jgi:A1 cistron-splicing factor AAR2